MERLSLILIAFYNLVQESFRGDALGEIRVEDAPGLIGKSLVTDLLTVFESIERI